MNPFYQETESVAQALVGVGRVPAPDFRELGLKVDETDLHAPEDLVGLVIQFAPSVHVIQRAGEVVELRLQHSKTGVHLAVHRHFVSYSLFGSDDYNITSQEPNGRLK